MRFAGVLAAATLFGTTAMAVDSWPVGVQSNGGSLSYSFSLHNDGTGGPFSDYSSRFLTYHHAFGLGQNTAIDVALMKINEDFNGSFFSERYAFGLYPSIEIDFGTLGGYLIGGTNNGDPEIQYGLETRFDIGAFDVESYFGVFLDEGEPFGALGLGASYRVLPGLALHAAHRRDYDDLGYLGLTSLGVTYDLSQHSPSAPPLQVTFEASKFHDENDGLFGSDWQQYSLRFTYAFGNDDSSIFGTVRSVDYFYD